MKVNYKSDFELTIQLTAGGVDVAAPSWDWQLRFYTCDRQAVYTVAHIDGKAERCAVNTDGTITAYFDKHGLMPGALRCEFVNLVPDSHYTHDTQMQVDPVELGVELWRGASDGGMDAVTLELAGQVLAEVQSLAADLQQKAESGYFDGEPGPQGPQGPPGPAGPGLLVVSVTGSDQEALTADHTAGEILAAHEAGRPVVAVYGGEVYQLASVGASLASFSLASADLDVLAQIDVDGDGHASRIFEEVQGVLTAGEGIKIDDNVISANIPDGAYIIDVDLDADPMTTTAVFADALAAFVAGRQVWFAGTSGGDLVFSVPVTFNYGGAGLIGITWMEDQQQTFTFTPNGVLFIQTDYVTTTALSTALSGKQDVLTFDNVPTQSSSNPVKSGGVFTALQGKADVTTLQNFCPIIEDTRSSAVTTITGVAPFATLQDGQRVLLKLNYNSGQDSTLNLTLSDGTTTGAIPIYVMTYNAANRRLAAADARAGGYIELIYNKSGNHWQMVGYKDTNTTYNTTNSTAIKQGTLTGGYLVSPAVLRECFYLKQEVDNLCPIIEDTRTSGTQVITGNAPFSELRDGQRITLKLKYNSAYNPSINLTLSNGESTGEKAIYGAYHQFLRQIGSNDLMAGLFATAVYDATNNRWVLDGKDYNRPDGMTSAMINSESPSLVVYGISPKILVDNFEKRTQLIEVDNQSAQVEQALESNTFYKFLNPVDELTLTFVTPTGYGNIMAIYGGKFTASTNWSALGIPATIDEAAGNDTVAGGKSYEFNVLDGIIVIKEV